uniref:Uncharacterized protein n=1 Tax=Chromera velia CCMP2878 TaxID=1169474 RepID=A0A0G4F6R2_9ALVE|eukprot:Cvel_15484.t1-p1 / transcript=Cvel_15484.t1 / gene=Cvel_15484 / organism=Chromera_velia_CCMP2878 / gene_product=hypothetical protein / transcript_product=hypothetical protein / location=Cvel_scaffold1148:36934-37254(+) / protein_length=107 / sequence_SO=supercontig / SO=protein_coding / is_pseudo=false
MVRLLFFLLLISLFVCAHLVVLLIKGGLGLEVCGGLLAEEREKGKEREKELAVCRRLVSLHTVEAERAMRKREKKKEIKGPAFFDLAPPKRGRTLKRGGKGSRQRER